jgi:hypothetical protein
MRTIVLGFALFASCLAGTTARAAGPASDGSVQFEHLSWQLACDNIGTCRAAGYQDGESLPVSVLLTREAGPGTPVTAQLTLGDDWEDSVAPRLPARFAISLRIDGRDLGRLMIDRDKMTARLTAAQTTQLVQALRRDVRIAFTGADQTWTLSDDGASAVLLKMDEAQGRLDTPGALHRPGKRSESQVPPARPVPVVRIAAVSTRPIDANFLARHEKALRKALIATISDENCDALTTPDPEDMEPLQLSRLTSSTLLVYTRCWMGAYNEGLGYWIIDERPPFSPRLVTTFANEYADGILNGSHKGRGLGDCWSSDSWVWDGTDFIHTESSTTGMCMGFPGGAWSLPTRVSDVRPAGSP